MKKKIVATLLAGAFVGTTLVSLAACSLALPDSDKVSEEVWVEAFENAANVKNYTAEKTSKITKTVNGTVTNFKQEWDGDAHEYKYKKTGDVAVKMELATSESAKYFFDLEANKYYSETKNSSKASKKEDDKKEAKLTGEDTDKKYYELSEEKEGEKTFWRAVCGSEKYNGSSEDGKYNSSNESYWNAYETDEFAETVMETIADYTFYTTDKIETASASTLPELYEKFVYSEDLKCYTSDLYQLVTFTDSIGMGGRTFSTSQLVKCSVRVSFNAAEKCLIGFKIISGTNGTAKEEYDPETFTGGYQPQAFDLSYRYEEETIYMIKDIKATDVSKKVNKDITKAIDKAKQEKAKAEAAN